jgi:2,3-bisphosphoglycerate-dependent phosphoglycerate mutase
MADTRICVTRHGETDWNIAGVLQGRLDVPLNDRGREQARELARRFAREGFTQVYTSPLARSRETAEIVASLLGLPPPVCHDGLQERNFGVIQGIPKAELAEANPALLREIVRRNPACEFEDGESLEECANRVLAAIIDIGVREPGARILVITHGWAMDVVTREVKGLPRHTIMHVKPKNGESVWLETDGRAIRPALGEQR